MRVLFWQEPFWPQVGGMTVMAERLLSNLRDRGHGIAVVTRRDSADLPRQAQWHGISVHRFPFWQALSGARPGEVAALRHEVAALKAAFAPDLVHLNGFGPSALFHLETARAHPVPLIVALHSANTLSSAPGAVARQLLEKADWVVACSRAMMAEARHSVPAIASSSSVVYNGADPREREPLPLPDEPRLLCLGDLEPHKGFDLALHTLALLRARFPALRLTVGGEGSARAELERLAVAAGVRDGVDFLGAVPHDEVPDVIDGATVVLVPSRRESFGLVALEAALAARPVVATRVGGLEEVVSHGEAGLLVEPESSAALAEAVARLLADRDLAVRLGAAARHRARREFDLRRQVDAYDGLYERVTRKGLRRDTESAAVPEGQLRRSPQPDETKPPWPQISANGADSAGLRHRRMRVIDALEIHLAHACNLTCESCSHYSNQGHDGIVSLAEADAWMKLWNGRLSPKVFSLLGGEPTIHPRLAELVALSRRNWPEAKLQIVTNGFLLHRHPQLPVVLAGDPNACIALSIHHASGPYRERLMPVVALLIDWTRRFGVRVECRPSHASWTRRYKGFGAAMAPFEDAQPRRSWENCPARTCKQLSEERIWKCPATAYLPLQHAKHGLGAAWEPYLRYEPLAPDCTEAELDAFFSREDESCCAMCPAEPEKFEMPLPLPNSGRF